MAFRDRTREVYIYEAILRFANGKRYVMRSPIRLWYELYYLSIHNSNSGNSGKRESTLQLKNSLRHLENEGYIRRLPGGIEIMENK